MTYSSEVLADSPWGYWRCQELSGATLADSSSNAHPLSITGTPTFGATGPVSGGGLAIGWPLSTSVYAKSSVAAVLSGSFTLEAWVKLAAFPSGDTALLGNGDNPTGSSRTEFGLLIDSLGRPKSYQYNVAAAVGSALTLNAWHHVVLIAAVGSPIRIRVDKVDTGSGGTTANYSYSRSLWVHGGGAQTTGGAVTIAEPAVYPTALSDTRLDAHFDAASGGGTPTQLSGVWGLVS